MDHDLGLVEGFRQGDGVLAPGQRRRGVSGEHGQARPVAAGHSQLPAAPSGARIARACSAAAIASVACPVIQAYRDIHAQRIPFADGVAARLPDLQRLRRSVDAAAPPIGQIALVRRRFEQLGRARAAAGSGQSGGHGRIAPPPRGGRGGWPPAARLPGRRRGRPPLAGGLGMVRQSGEILFRQRSDSQRGQNLAMQVAPARRRDRVVDRYPRQFVPKGQARRPGRRASRWPGTPRSPRRPSMISARARRRSGSRSPPPHPGPPGPPGHAAMRANTASPTVAGTRRRRLVSRQDLGGEEGIAPGQAIEGDRVDPRPGQRRMPVRREWRQVQPAQVVLVARSPSTSGSGCVGPTSSSR